MQAGSCRSSCRAPTFMSPTPCHMQGCRMQGIGIPMLDRDQEISGLRQISTPCQASTDGLIMTVICHNLSAGLLRLFRVNPAMKTPSLRVLVN